MGEGVWGKGVATPTFFESRCNGVVKFQIMFIFLQVLYLIICIHLLIKLVITYFKCIYFLWVGCPSLGSHSFMVEWEYMSLPMSTNASCNRSKTGQKAVNCTHLTSLEGFQHKISEWYFYCFLKLKRLMLVFWNRDQKIFFTLKKFWER